MWESFGVSWDLLGEPRAERLLNASRELRIEALKYFPKLAAQMKAEGENALKAIEEAKKFVK